VTPESSHGAISAATKPGIILDPLDRATDDRKWTVDASGGFWDGAFHLKCSRSCWAYEFRNGLAQIETEHVSGSLTTAYGMCFRYKRRGGSQGASGYWVLIAANGAWKLVRMDATSRTTLTEWAKSAAIRTGLGARNTLEVICQGSIMAVFINGQMVGQTDDLTYMDGGGVGPVCTSDKLEVAFRNLKIDPDF
jgi:hypothetical protein